MQSTQPPIELLKFLRVKIFVFGFYFQSAEVFDVKLKGQWKYQIAVTNLNGLFKNRNVKQRKHPHLQKVWCHWNSHLKTLAQTPRTSISKEILRHGHPWNRLLRDPSHGSPAWGWGKVVAPPQLQDHSNFIYRRCRWPPKGFVSIWKGKGKEELHQAFPVDVHAVSMTKGLALFFAESAESRYENKAENERTRKHVGKHVCLGIIGEMSVWGRREPSIHDK